MPDYGLAAIEQQRLAGLLELRAEAMRDLLEMIGDDPEAVALNVAVIRLLLNPDSDGTQAEIGRKFGLSKGRISDLHGTFTELISAKTRRFSLKMSAAAGFMVNKSPSPGFSR